jgi:hypothetical protein
VILLVMAVREAIQGALDTLYLDRKGVVGSPGFDSASEAWNLIRTSPDQKSAIWESAVRADRADRATWGTFRALVEAWILETTKATFSFPNV